MSRDVWILYLWRLCCPIRSAYHKRVSSCMFDLLIFWASFWINGNSIFRWSDPHAVPPMVLVHWVVVTYRRNRSRLWQRPSWQRKPKCCAKSSRHSKWWPIKYNRCNRCTRSLDLSSFAHPEYLPRLIWIPLSVQSRCWRGKIQCWIR
jgi:hypothetical protein